MLISDVFCVFFFKQKTEYEMRISDWSSDVCASDLGTVSLDGKGNYIPYAPKFTLDVGASYTLHVRDAKLLFNVTEAYNDGYYFESDNNIRQKAFSFLNASVTWTDRKSTRLNSSH